MVPLDGEWEFYWNQLLTPEDFQNRQKLLKIDHLRVPGIWKGKTPNGQELLPQGYATYRLLIHHKPDNIIKSLLIKTLLSTCNIWVNGLQVATSGQVGKSRGEEHPRQHTTIPHFRFSGDTTEIILQVSNFHNVQAGIGAPIWLGNQEQLLQKNKTRLILTAVLAGMFIIIGLHHLLKYALRTIDPENLYFGIYCLVWSVGITFGDSGDNLMHTVFPSLPWRLAIDMTLLSYAASPPLIIMLYHSLFPRERSPIIKYFYQAVGLLFVIYLLATPPNAFGPVVRIYMNVSFLIIPYLGYQFIVDVIRKEKGARMLILGYIILVLSVINDKMYDAHIINTVTLVPFGATFFLLSYSLMISIRSAQTHTEVENISIELEEKNVKLEASIHTLKENIQLKMELQEQKQKKELARIETEKSVLEKLRYQLNPHFLFNVLTSIRGAILKDRDIAREMVSNLSEFCRITLSSGREEWLEVEKEIEQVELYLRIEQVRLGDYLTTQAEIDPELKSLLIPSLLLQPLVENAVKYGKQTAPENLDVKISAKNHNKALFLEVSNTGKWIAPGTASRAKSMGIGLENLKKRLQRLYPGKHSFHTKEESGSVIAQVEIQLSELKKSS
ncbi:MAG: histidine kinase [Deltaproteobacteria bacterium]|nr:histidine kinase [Deltaproteobacteria bacterium]